MSAVSSYTYSLCFSLGCHLKDSLDNRKFSTNLTLGGNFCISINFPIILGLNVPNRLEH